MPASSVKIYVNGAEVPSYWYEDNAIGTRESDAAEPFDIGVHRHGTEEHLRGRLDHVAIWNTVLTPAEVASLYATQSSCP